MAWPPKTDPAAVLGFGLKTCWLGGKIARKRYSLEQVIGYLREVEKENTRLWKLMADLSLYKAILKEAAEGKY